MSIRQPRIETRPTRDMAPEELPPMGGLLPLRSAVPLCSPVHRCFPPMPTVCLICRRESGDGCPLREDTR